MSKTKAVLTIVAVAIAPVLVSASDRADAPKKDSKVVQTTTEASPLATLKGIKAAPMSATELKAVKGQHAHFWNPGRPFGPGPIPETEPHVVNSNNLGNWSDLYGQGPVGPGYHGLCKAATNGSSAIFINPGGGCGF